MGLSVEEVLAEMDKLSVGSEADYTLDVPIKYGVFEEYVEGHFLTSGKNFSYSTKGGGKHIHVKRKD